MRLRGALAMTPAKARRPATPRGVSLDLIEAVKRAVQAERAAIEERNSGGKRSAPMFFFVQALRGHPELIELEAIEALNIVARILQMLSPPSGCGLDAWAEALNYEDAPAAFIEEWPIIQFPVGLFDRAVRLATRRALPIKSGFSPKYDAFLALCSALQQQAVDKPIIVSTTRFGKALGVSARTVSTYISLAVSAGLLYKAKEAVRFSRAAEFYFKQDKHGSQGNQV
jgi:hypothetical protein